MADGYASDVIHRFDPAGKYLTSFGGKKEPYGFSTLHKLALDTRFTPARLIACDRANNRVVHLSLDGEFLGVVAKNLLLPAASSSTATTRLSASCGGASRSSTSPGRPSRAWA